MFYVYIIFNTINGKFYVGQSIDKHRWQRHIYISKNKEYSSHMLIHRAMAKYGVHNFEFKIIAKIFVRQTRPLVMAENTIRIN
jgi:group I intron endonuclease